MCSNISTFANSSVIFKITSMPNELSFKISTNNHSKPAETCYIIDNESKSPHYYELLLSRNSPFRDRINVFRYRKTIFLYSFRVFRDRNRVFRDRITIFLYSFRVFRDRNRVFRDRNIVFRDRIIIFLHSIGVFLYRITIILYSFRAFLYRIKPFLCRNALQLSGIATFRMNVLKKICSTTLTTDIILSNQIVIT